jgi:hypothetical protein
MADSQRNGPHRRGLPGKPSTPGRRHRAGLVAVIGAAGVAVAITLAVAVQIAGRPARAVAPIPQNGDTAPPTTSDSYTGLYPAGAPSSNAGVTAFTRAIGVTPDVITYYSGWLESGHLAIVGASLSAITAIDRQYWLRSELIINRRHRRPCKGALHDGALSR